MDRLLVLLAVLAVAGVLGLGWRARNGRLRPAPTAEEPVTTEHTAWSALGIRPTDASVTLVQFSSAFCAPCRATRQVLGRVAARWPEVRHVEVDAEAHLDEVRALSIHSTPTTLLVDHEGRIVNRAVGLPREAEVIAAVGARLIGTSRTEHPTGHIDPTIQDGVTE